MNEMQTAHAGWKKKVVHELIEYWINFGYLAFFLVAFMWYRRLILAEYQVQYTDYWVPPIEVVVLAKVIMIGDLFRVSHGLEQKPLILPALYRTVMFSIWVAIFNVLEATVKGLFHGNGLMGGIDEISSRGWYELLSRCVVILVAFIPFFSFKELERVMGPEKLRGLFWKRRTPVASSLHGTEV